MKRLFVLLIAILTVCNLALAQELEENTILNDVFEQHKATGTLVIYDVKNNKYFVHNTARAKQEFYPASSFKIFNSLIGLEYGAVKNVDEVFYHYHGEKVFLDSWKADSNLRYAIKVSQVPAYQLLAHKIGMGNMKEGLAKLNYGNQEIGDKLDEFWLAGPLKISALQQADLLTKLAQNKLPFAVENQKQVADITVLSVNDSMFYMVKQAGQQIICLCRLAGLSAGCKQMIIFTALLPILILIIPIKICRCARILY